MHNWTEDEMKELLRPGVMDTDCWCYCKVCGMEISPIERDADMAWCETCNAK